jgi:hypothetical protein
MAPIAAAQMDGLVKSIFLVPSPAERDFANEESTTGLDLPPTAKV